jgi:hypothetical protein
MGRCRAAAVQLNLFFFYFLFLLFFLFFSLDGLEKCVRGEIRTGDFQALEILPTIERDV